MTKTINTALAHPDVIRYVKLLFLIMAGGAIYPLLYLRQNFELTLISTMGLALRAQCCLTVFSGMAFFLSYVPSGWLADRFSPRLLLTFSVVMTGCDWALVRIDASCPVDKCYFWFVGYHHRAYLWAALIKGCKFPRLRICRRATLVC